MLTQQDIDLLEFEDMHPRRTGPKTDGIIHTLGLRPATYYQRLHHLVKQREVIERWPQLAYRIGRLSQRRQEERAALKRFL